MRIFPKYAAILVLGFGLSAVTAHAASIDLLTFNSPQISGPVSASIAASPTPSSFINGISFTLSGITSVFEGTSLSGPVTFFDAGGVGGGGIVFSGPKLFSGTDAAPTFLLGSFALSGIADLGNGSVQAVTGTLTISQPAATPEPMPLVLTATGMLGLGGLLRKRHKQLQAAAIHC